jgi:hypothetical protein
MSAQLLSAATLDVETNIGIVEIMSPITSKVTSDPAFVLRIVYFSSDSILIHPVFAREALKLVRYFLDEKISVFDLKLRIIVKSKTFEENIQENTFKINNALKFVFICLFGYKTNRFVF